MSYFWKSGSVCGCQSSCNRKVTGSQVCSCKVSSVSLCGTAVCGTEVTKAGNSACADLTTTLFVVILEFVLIVTYYPCKTMLLTGIDTNFFFFCCVPAHAFPLLSMGINIKPMGFGEEVLPPVPKPVKYQYQGLVSISCRHSSELSI